MADRMQQIIDTPIGRQVAGTLGLPVPVELRRYEPGAPLVHGPVLVGGAPGGRLIDPALKTLHTIGADVRTDAPTGDTSDGVRYAALLYDASGITNSAGLRDVYTFFHPLIKRLDSSARVLVLGAPPPDTTDWRAAAAQRALEGFIRSTGKEMRRGTTANLIQVAGGAENHLESSLRFFVSGRSAFVAGQVVRIHATTEDPDAPDDWDRPLAGKAALVTGAAQGIGEKIAETLARDGAHVVCLDVPAQGERLSSVANRIGGSSLQLDITADDAPRRIADHLAERHDGADIVVHNAGITRDRTLVGMSDGEWDAVLAVNLTSQERINEVLLDEEVLTEHGRIVCISSMSGIAGNRGQTNYASSKAGIIGMVEALAPELERQGGTINAVAPGFIETEMTGEMPFVTREVGRRMNSLNQGGLPIDVAETVAWLANPATGGVNGGVVRVCGQNMLGA